MRLAPVWIAASAGAVIALAWIGATQVITEHSTADAIVWLLGLYLLVPGLALSSLVDGLFPRMNHPVWVFGWIVVLNGAVYGLVAYLWLRWRHHRTVRPTRHR